MSTQKAPEGVSFTGSAGALSNSPWLASTDLLGLGDVECEIEDVILYKSVTFDAGRKQENVPALKFKGRSKQLVLTAAANRKALARMFGANTVIWRGKRIKLYVDNNVRQVGGGTGPGLRIREQ